MCQLTYANTKDSYTNSLLVYLLGTIGSIKHDDGCGFVCSDNDIWKSQLAAEKITNLGTIINKFVVDNKPVPFHIRSATYGIEVTKENSHPFDGKHFILMHNGTLVPRNGEESKDKKHDSDSLLFLKTLDECKDKSPDASFEEIFKEAMTPFAGKFAFIIREKSTSTDYIVRGRTAELWISKFNFDGTESGYVINTSKDTMKDAFMQFKNIWDLFFTNLCEFSEPTLIDQETIFVAEETTITKIGKATEVEPKRETKALARGSNYNSGNAAGTYGRYEYDSWKGYDEADGKAILEKAKKIYDFLSDHSMGLLDFQLIVMITGGVSILELTEEDLNMFNDYLLPKISANSKIRAKVKDILKDNSKVYVPNEIYEKYELEYPWTVNDGDKVIKALEEYFKEI